MRDRTSRISRWVPRVSVLSAWTTLMCAAPASASWPLTFEAPSRVLNIGPSPVQLTPPADERYYTASLRASGAGYLVLQGLGFDTSGGGPPGVAKVDVRCGNALETTLDVPTA